MAGNKKKEILLRANLGFLFICLLGMAIIGRAFYIQTVQGPYYRSLADSLTIFPKKIMAERGNIYSADGRLLATSQPTFDIRVNFKAQAPYADNVIPPQFNQGIDSLALLLSQTYKDKTVSEYRAELVRERNNQTRYYLLKKAVSLDQMLAMKQWPLFRTGHYRLGMVAIQNDRRMKPFGGLAWRTIGYTNSQNVKVGLEGQYDSLLRGTEGQMMVQKLSGGVTIPIDSKEEIAPQPGKDVFTTLNVDFQDVAEDALLKALQKHDAKYGCVIMMEVKTGKIRVMANLGMDKDSGYSENENYAIGAQTEPGSTFKLATVASLMEDGLVNNNTLVDVGDGEFQVYDRVIKDHERPKSPILTVKRAIEVSSNVAVAKLAYQHYSAQPEKFYKHLESFGFTKPVDIELVGAKTGLLANPKKWSGVSASYIAYGYEVRITPLHLLTFYNAIANNGCMVKPYIVEKVKEYNKVIDSTGTTVLNPKLLSATTVKQLHEILEGVVNDSGTAKNLNSDLLHLAGKTGTAVVARDNKGYKDKDSHKFYQASFCGYFPAENPVYSMIVVIDSPNNGYYANVVAGTIFKDIAEKVYSLTPEMHPAVTPQGITAGNIPAPKCASSKDVAGIYKYLGIAVNNINGEWANVNSNGNNVSLTDHTVENGVVPDVTGMSLKDALYMLESIGLKVNVIGRGMVVKQSIPAGDKLKRGEQIVIELT